jgi:hypothetical protein
MPALGSAAGITPESEGAPATARRGLPYLKKRANRGGSASGQ